MKRLIYCVFILLTLINCLYVSSVFCQTDIGVDLILLLDSSRSMKDSYSEYFEREAIDYTVEFLRKYNTHKNRLGIIHFASSVHLTQSLTDINKQITSEPEKKLDTQHTLFNAAFELADKEFTEADSFSGTHSPQILMITDGKLYNSTGEFKQYEGNEEGIEKVRQRLIENKLIPFINEFKRKGCCVNIIHIKGSGGIKQTDIEQKLEKDKKVWNNFVHNTGGLFTSLNRLEFHSLKDRYDKILSKMLDLYSIEMLEPSDSSHSAEEPISIKARLFKDRTIIVDTSIRVKATIREYPSKLERVPGTTRIREGMYIWDFDQPTEDKFDIQIVAFWEDERNVFAELSKMILVKEIPVSDTKGSQILLIFISSCLGVVMALVLLYFFVFKKLFDSYREAKIRKRLKSIEKKSFTKREKAGKCIDNGNIEEGRKAFREVFQKLKDINEIRQSQNNQIFSETSEFAYENYEKNIKKRLDVLKNDYLTEKEFNDKKFELRKEYYIPIFKTDPDLLKLLATQQGIANMILYSIKEAGYESNFFEDIAIIMEIFEKNRQGLLNTLRSVEYGLDTLENKNKHTEIKRNVYKSYIELLRVNDENVDAVLKNTVKSIKDTSSRIPMHKELSDLYSKVYNSFERIFKSPCSDRIFLTRIREFFEQSPSRDRENYNYKLYRNVLKAIEDKIRKNVNIKSRTADLDIMLLNDEKREVFYSEKNGDSKSGHITLPIRLINKGSSPAWNIAIWIELDKDSHFAPSAYHNILSIYPTPEILPDVQEDEFGNTEIKEPGIGLIPIKLNARHGKIDNRNKEIKIKVIKFIIDFIDYSTDKKEGTPRTREEEFKDIKVKFNPINDIHNPYNSHYGNNIFYLKSVPEIFCDRRKINDFVKEKVESESNSALNLYGLPGTGKTSFMFDFQEKEKENYTVIVLGRKEHIEISENYSKRVKSDYMLFFSDLDKTEELGNNGSNFLAVFNRQLGRKVKMKKPVILFIDDIDDLVKILSDWGGKRLEDFFKSLCKLVKREENVNLVLCGRKSLKEIEDDNNLKDIIDISDSKEFGTLNKDQFNAYFDIKSKVSGESVYTEHAINSILTKTGGNPRFLQSICYNLIKSKEDWRYDRPLDFWDVDEISNMIVKEREWYLDEFWNGFDKAEQAALKILASKLKTNDKSIRLIERPSHLVIREELVKTGSLNKNEYPTDVIKRLIAKGIIIHSRGVLDFRTALLRKWINNLIQ